MKHIDKGYTFIESLIVLGIIAGVITFGVQNSLPQTSNINHWETAFHSNWQHVRLTAQQKQQKCYVCFKEKSVAMAHANLIYPKGYRHKGQQQLDILPTGYVAPTTVTLTNGSAYIKIIFSFGGGEYRVEKS